MQKALLIIFLIILSNDVFSQTINDNKVSFEYTQLPLIKVRKDFQIYDTKINHAYLESNKDSLTIYEARKNAAKLNYEAMYSAYKQKYNTLQIAYFQQLSSWEQKINAGQTQSNGSAFPKPNSPIYPSAPTYLDVKEPRLNSELDEENTLNEFSIEGFEKGLGGSVLTIDIQAIRGINIVHKKTGSGVKTKHTYYCEFNLPILVKFETPTDGIILQEILFQNKSKMKMKDQKSHYDHLVYMLQNETLFYNNLEVYARNAAIKAANAYINNQLGYVKKQRNTEVYSVKRFKKHDYTDVTKAFSTTVSALREVSKDNDHSGAREKLDAALASWKDIMFESNDYDNKARINDKISAVIWCNIAEIQFWLNNFDEQRSASDLALNLKVIKAKNHVQRMKSFYSTQQTRWNVHY